MAYESTQINLVLDIKPGQWFIADVIGKGIYEMVQNGVNYAGNKFAIVKCKKIFGKGFIDFNHETTCHPIDPATWNNLKRLNRKINYLRQ